MWSVLETYACVDRITLAQGRLVAQVDGAEVWIIEIETGRVLGRAPGSDWAVSAKGIAITNDKHVTGLALDGVTPLGAREMNARVSAIALADDGRLAVGTDDQVAHVGDWALDRFTFAPARVPDGAADVWSPCIRGVGFLDDGSVLVIGGTGSISRLDEKGLLCGSLHWEDLAYSEEAIVHCTRGGCLIATDAVRPEAIALVRAELTSIEEHWGGAELALPWLLVRGTALVRSSPSGNELSRFAIDDPRVVALGVDGEGPVLGRSDGTVAWCSPDDASVLEEVDLGVGEVRAVSVAGDRLVALDTDGTLVLAARGAVVGPKLLAPKPRLDLVPARVLQLDNLGGVSAWSSNAQRFGVLSHTFKVHDALDGRCLLELSDGEAMNVFHAQGAWIVYFRNAIHVIDEQSLCTLVRADVPSANLTYEVTSAHGLILASGSGVVRVDVRRGAIERIATQRQGATATAPANVRRVMATATRLIVEQRDGGSLLLDSQTADRIAELPGQDARWAPSPDGALLVDAHSGAIVGASDGSVRGQLDASCEPATSRGYLRRAIWFPSGEGLVRIGDGAALFRRDGTRVRSLLERGDPCADISEDGSRLVLGDAGYLGLFTAAGERIAEHRYRGAQRVPQFVSASRIFAPARQVSDNPACPWLLDAATGERVGLLRGVLGAPHKNSPIIWGGDRVVMATYDAPKAQVFGLTDAAPLGALSGHDRGLSSLSLHPSGRWLLTCDDTGRTSIWDAALLQ